MRAFLMWLDQVTQCGSVTETDSKMSIDLPETVLDRPGIVALLLQDDLLFPPEVFVDISRPPRPAPLLPSDVELPDGLVPCPDHDQAYVAVLSQQTHGRHIPEWSRLALLRDMASCSGCAVRLTLTIRIDKEQCWQNIRGTWPPDVDSKIWFYPAKVAEATSPKQYLAWNARPLVLGVRGPAPMQSQYVTCVDLAADDFVHQAVMTAESLSPRTETLSNHLKDRPLAGPDAHSILPPEYWAGEDILAAERFPELLPLPGLFLIGVLGQICHRVTRGAGDAYLFQADGARPMEVRCRLTQSGVELDGTEHVLTGRSSKGLLRFYREAIQGKPQGQNLDLLQQAIRMAGDAKLTSLVTDIGEIEAYYDFQWKALAKSRFKEQIELIKSYLAAVQTARGKVSTAMDELYKNLTSVVTGAAALAAVLVTAAATKNAQIYDYLMISSVLIAFPYIPIHVLRARSLVAAAEMDLAQFRTDLDLSAQELGFPLQILNVSAQIEGSSKQLRERVAVTVFWLGVMIVLSVATALVSYQWGQSSIKTLVPRCVILPLIVGAALVPGGMLLSFWRQHRSMAPRS